MFATTPQRLIHTSYFPSQLMRKREEEDFDCFLLSDLADQQNLYVERKL